MNLYYLIDNCEPTVVYLSQFLNDKQLEEKQQKCIDFANGEFIWVAEAPMIRFSGGLAGLMDYVHTFGSLGMSVPEFFGQPVLNDAGETVGFLRSYLDGWALHLSAHLFFTEA